MFFRNTTVLAFFGVLIVAVAAQDRTTAQRLRNPNPDTVQSSSSSSTMSYDRFFQAWTNGPVALLHMLTEEKAQQDAHHQVVSEPDAHVAMMEVFEALASNLVTSMSIIMSMPPTAAPQQSPSSSTTVAPVVTKSPTNSPSNSKIPATDPGAATPVPTNAPNMNATATPSPPPSIVAASVVPTDSPVSVPAVDTVAPIGGGGSSGAPTTTVSPVPVVAPPTSSAPVVADSPTQAPAVTTTTSPAVTTAPQTTTTEPSNCPGNITKAQRVEQIMTILDAVVANATDIRNLNLPQGVATEWLLYQDLYDRTCPDNDKLVQRWALAVMYYSTGGNDWFQCSANDDAFDNCGQENPFLGEERFLAATNECEWAGIDCDADQCVTEIKFEENNLVGTIPTEIGLLSSLMVWGMERGGLTSTIPTEVGQLTNLIFIDLDYNQLTGSLTSELYSLNALTQLDLNNNRFSGNISGMTGYFDMEFLQLHDNLFSGTIPTEIGMFSQLTVFTVHESSLSGFMPSEVCRLLPKADFGGVLTSLSADCTKPNPKVHCKCCTDCRASE